MRKRALVVCLVVSLLAAVAVTFWRAVEPARLRVAPPPSVTTSLPASAGPGATQPTPLATLSRESGLAGTPAGGAPGARKAGGAPRRRLSPERVRRRRRGARAGRSRRRARRRAPGARPPECLPRRGDRPFERRLPHRGLRPDPGQPVPGRGAEPAFDLLDRRRHGLVRERPPLPGPGPAAAEGRRADRGAAQLLPLRLSRAARRDAVLGLDRGGRVPVATGAPAGARRLARALDRGRSRAAAPAHVPDRRLRAR